DTQARNFFTSQLDALRTLPGVTNVGLSTGLPFTASLQNAVIMIDACALAPGELPPVPFWNFVDSGYFGALGIPLLQGRLIAEADTADAPKVAVIDQNVARRYWPKGDGLGARVHMGASSTNERWTIVGIV